jgi:capsular exopolysaccharide synthesis family protein
MPPVSALEPIPASRPTDRVALTRVLGLLRRRYRVVLLYAVIAAAVAYGISRLEPDKYTASASLLFRNDSTSLDALNSANVPATPAEQPAEITATNAQLVTLSTIANRTATVLHMTPSAVRAAVQASPQGVSDVVQITATTRKPALSAQIANTYAAQFVAFRAQIDSRTIVAAETLAQSELAKLSPTERAGSIGRTLQGRVEDLSLAASLQSGNAETVQTARLPTGPSSPRPKRNAAIGLLLGLILGVLVVLGVDRFDRRIRDESEIEAILDRPVLGSLPKSRVLATPGIPEFSPGDLEAFQLVRANLKFFVKAGDRQAGTYLMTSAQPGDGKTTVSLFLGIAAAVAGESVLVIEADLRKGGRMPADTGLSLVLAGITDLDSAIRPMQIPRAGLRGDESAGATTVDILPAGPRPPNPTDLMGSPRMRSLIEECERRYDLIIIDAPPLTMVSDAIPLTAAVTGVIVVLRLGHSDRAVFRRMTEILRNLRAPVTGIVINGESLAHPEMYGYYGYADPAPLRPVA